MLNLVAVIGLITMLGTGCSTIKTLTPAQVSQISIGIQQTAQIGATYAIRQNTNNVKYFVLADAALSTFVLGTDLSPASFQSALANVGLQDQWAQLAVSAVIIAYTATYNQYVINQVNSNAMAKEFLLAVDNGFKVALGKPVVPMVPIALKGERTGAVPYFLKDGKIDKNAIYTKVLVTKR